MLKLKRVQILGFKSFCDRTDVQLSGAGIAAIVGPNGCGKSNISDAITWVLGEQSAKSLRGTKMEDVIFAGTRDRKPTGMAEVSLTLVDPDVYDAADAGQPINIASADRRPAELHDWDEQAEREGRADATAEAVALAQPGPLQGDEETEAAAESDESATTADSGDPVVLRVRRRKFNRAPVRAGEITVTRRLFRSGDSEYLLNGKLCRLRDIQDIFFGTGLSGENYAIIGQERIGQLLSSKPLDRRAIIEEAAGVTRFKTKKRLAELRLEASKQNLSRIDDVFEEVSKQMVSLKRQAAKADRYGQLREELRARLRVVLRSRLVQKHAERQQAETTGAELGRAIDAQASTIEALDAEHTAAVSRGYQLEEELRELQARSNDNRLERERAGARIASNQDRVADLETRAGAMEAEAAHVREQLASYAAEQDALRSFLETAQQAAEQARQQAQERGREAQEVQAKGNAAERETAQARQASLQLTHRISQIHREEAQATEALASLRRDAERLAGESEQARRDLEDLGRQRGQVSLAFESTTERLQRLQAEIAQFRLDMDAGRQEEATLRRQGDQMRAEAAALRGKKQSLESQMRDHAYSNETVRKLLKANTGAAATTLGTLADFLEVDDSYGTLVDEFLNDELNFVVVETWDGARKGIELLQTALDGRATFVVRDTEGPTAPERGEEAYAEMEGAVRLQQVVRALPTLGVPLVEILPKLGRTFVAPDTATARRLALLHPELYLVTQAGEVCHGRAVTGGKTRAGGPLVLKRELRDAESKLEQLQAQLAACDVSIATLTKRTAEMHHAMEARREERGKAEREAANSGAALRQMESEAARVERRLAEWSLQSERNRDAVAAKHHTVEQKQAEAAQLSGEREALDLRVQAVANDMEALRAKREEAQSAAAAANATLAGLEERRRNAAANVEGNQRLHRNAEARVAQLTAQMGEAASEKLRREQENEAAALLVAELSAVGRQLVEDVAGRSAEVTTLRASAADQGTQLRALRVEIDQIRERRGTLQAAAARLSADIEHLQAQSLHDLNLPAAELEADEAVSLLPVEQLDEAEAEAHTLRGKLESMGPVNMMALEEYEEASQRHGFLETQRKDLMESIANTQSAIREIDDVTRQKFNEAFAIINQNFSNTFTKLFGGGQAMMKLTDEADAMESGIDLIASPPGKKLQNVLLLSGGEKALTALSLLVGIFEHQPSPFCILDEVDAPLDEANVGRFARLVHEMSRDTQFVVITHHKRTMGEADLIYGVTMQEPGVSKIVSVDLNRGERKAVA